MKSLFLYKIFAVTVCVASSTGAQSLDYRHFITGNDFHEMCRNDFTSAYRYTVGVFDTLYAMNVVLNKQVSLPCMAPTTGARVTQIACRYVNSHPESRDQSAALLIFLGFAEASPC
ncbi:Rap1a/Tai family immunity protein [Primorskyibacter flagellatus]|uniref:Rap1a/Tai family immunity protein n=1 Tax=Primorskyibacter flagellatus TaxID=1387277 RepID=UPI003A93CBFF